MRRLIGLLGSWALCVLGLGLASIAVAGEWINIKDSRKFQRYAVIEKLLGERVADRAAELQRARGRSGVSRSLVRSRMATASRTIVETQGMSRPGKDSSAGVLPDGYFVEMARKKGMNVIRLNPGQAIDADTGRAARQTGGGVWDWIGESAGSQRVLTVVNNTVVEVSDGVKRELPPGELIRAGDTIVIPPLGAPQRGKMLREKGESIFGGRADERPVDSNLVQ